MTRGFDTRRSLLVVLAVALPLLALRLFTPYEFQESDQGKQAQYALDVVQNGNWLAPGCLGVAATKPPLYTWLAAIVSHASGGIDDWTIRVPAVLAALGLVLVVWDIARHLAGPRVAAAAAIATLTSHHFIQLAGRVRTDGLLAFLLAAQLLVYVRTLGSAMPSRSVALSAALAAAACLAKGPAGLLSCAVIALHLLATGNRRRLLREVLVPAIAGAAALGTWLWAAGQTRADLYDTMIDGELARHLSGQGLPNPLYYVLAMPLRLAPWVVLLPSAAALAWKAVRNRRTAPVPPVVSLALAWLAVHLAMFSFLSHQRPDLIFPAEPAVLLVAALLVERTWPAWTSKAVAVALLAGAIVVGTPLGTHLLPPAAPPFVGPLAAALLAGGATATLAIRSRNIAVACFAGLASIGIVDLFLDSVAKAPHVELVSYGTFGRLARGEAERRGAHLAAVGVDRTAALFDLRMTSPSQSPASLATAPRPLLVVTVPPHRRLVEDTIGPCDLVAKDDTAGGPGEMKLILLAPR